MKSHNYKITCEYIADDAGNSPNAEPLSFEIALHENIFEIIQKISEKEEMPTQDAPAFGLGLKLFGEVVRKNQDIALLNSLQPHLIEIMKIIKKA